MAGVPQGKPTRGGRGKRMRDVRGAADGQTPGREVLQPVLLSAGGRPGAQRGDL